MLVATLFAAPFTLNQFSALCWLFLKQLSDRFPQGYYSGVTVSRDGTILRRFMSPGAITLSYPSTEYVCACHSRADTGQGA